MFTRSKLPVLRPPQTEPLGRMWTGYTVTDPMAPHNRFRLSDYIDHPVRAGLALGAGGAVMWFGIRWLFEIVMWLGDHLAAWLS